MKKQTEEFKLEWLRNLQNGIFQNTFYASSGKIKSQKTSPFKLDKNSTVKRIDNLFYASFFVHVGDLETDNPEMPFLHKSNNF